MWTMGKSQRAETGYGVSPEFACIADLPAVLKPVRSGQFVGG